VGIYELSLISKLLLWLFIEEMEYNSFKNNGDWGLIV